MPFRKLLKLADVRRRSTYANIVAFLAYLVIAMIATWPLVANLNTHLPGPSTDTFVHYWNGWWVKQALYSDSGRSPFYTPYLFYPTGVSLVTHNIAWFHVLLWLLFERIFNGILAYNLVLIITLALCGTTAFLLVKELLVDARVAFLAGFIYLLWPFRLSQLDHPNLLSTQWTPLFFLFFIYTVRYGRWRDSFILGALFALIGYTRWQQLIPVTTTALIFFIFSVPSWLPHRPRIVLSRLVISAAVAIVLLLPPILLLTGQLGYDGGSVNLLDTSEESSMQTDLLAYLTPPGTHLLLGVKTQSLYDNYYHDRSGARRNSAYVGVTVLLLVIIGMRYNWRKNLVWGVMAAALVLLALGPLLRINGQFFENVPTPYRLLAPLELFRLMRIPDRFNMFLALPVSILTAYGIAQIATWSKKTWLFRNDLIVGLIGLFIFLEYMSFPVALHDVSVRPSFYDQIARESGEFAILNLPFNPIKAKRYMFDQVWHNRPIVQGKAARLPENVYQFVESNPWLSTVRRTNEMSPEFNDVSRQLIRLAQEGVRYIILHRDQVDADQVARWQRFLVVAPRYTDQSILAFSTTPIAGQNFALTQNLVPELGLIANRLSATCINPGQTLAVDVDWGSVAAPEQAYDIALSLIDGNDTIQFSRSYPLLNSWPTNEWPANTVARGYHEIDTSAAMPTGTYRILLSLMGTQSREPAGETVSVGSLVVQAEVCNLAQNLAAKGVNSLFDNNLRLVAYQISQDNASLHLTLYWHLLHRVDIDYKMFVHVFDGESGIPVAQSDYMPRNWEFPTTYWWAGDIVADPVTISLAEVAAGTYGIAIGVYNPENGGRLLLKNANGTFASDGRLILDDVVEIEDLAGD